MGTVMSAIAYNRQARYIVLVLFSSIVMFHSGGSEDIVRASQICN